MSLILEAKLDGLKEIENLIEQAFLWAIDFNAKEFKDYLTFRHCSVKVEENPIMRLTDKHLMTVLKLSRAQRKKIFWEKESSEESESNSKKLGRNS